jgi:hypothetical protein
LAEQQVGSPDLSNHVAILRDRFAAARLRGDRVHQREEARFTLELLKKPQEALLLAQENFRVQKEPADSRILISAARAAKNPFAEKEAVNWLEEKRRNK